MSAANGGTQEWQVVESIGVRQRLNILAHEKF